MIFTFQPIGIDRMTTTPLPVVSQMRANPNITTTIHMEEKQEGHSTPTLITTTNTTSKPTQEDDDYYDYTEELENYTDIPDHYVFDEEIPTTTEGRRWWQLF